MMLLGVVIGSGDDEEELRDGSGDITNESSSNSTDLFGA
jgi:hypothetical protein